MADKITIDRAVAAEMLEFLVNGNFVYPTKFYKALRAALDQPALAQQPAVPPSHIEAWTWFDQAGNYHLSRDEPPEGESVFQLTALVAKLNAAPEAPSVQQEPVAWMYDWLAPGHDKPVCDWISQDKDEVFDQRNGYFNIRALYTHPAPAEVRGPLTREQVQRMWREFSPLIGGIFDLVAAVEKHHGITGSKA